MPELTKVQTGFLEGQGQFELDPGTEAAPGVTFGDSSTGLYKSATDELAFSVSGDQKFRVDSTGIAAADNLSFTVSGNEQLTVKQNYLGVNTSSPSETLHVNGTAGISGNIKTELEYPTVKPTFNFDFIHYPKLDSRLNFTRESGAYRYSNKKIKTEENLLLNSQDFSQSWGIGNAISDISSTTDVTAPDGTTTAYKITADGTNTWHGVDQSFNGDAGPFIWSIFAKAGTESFIQLRTNSTPAGYANFDLNVGKIGSYGSMIPKIEDYGNGWYRCSVKVTAGDTVHVTFEVSNYGSGGRAAANTASGYIYVWGGQVEYSDEITGYVKTTTKPVVKYETLYEYVDAHVPRFEYDVDTRQPLGLLIEEQRTNFFTNSQNFASSDWTPKNMLVRSNYAIAPDGTQTADRLESTGGDPYCYQSKSLVYNTVYTASVWVKGVDSTIGKTFQIRIGSGTGYSKNFTLTDKWQRCIHTYTHLGAGGNYNVGFEVPESVTGVSTPIDGDAVYMWGAQFEAGNYGNYASSYIKTEDTTAYRAGEVVKFYGEELEELFNQNAWTVYTEHTWGPSGTTTATPVQFARTVFSLSGIYSDTVQLYNGSGLAVVYASNGRSTAAFLNFGSKNGGQYYKFALSYDGSSLSGFYDGGNQQTTTADLLYDNVKVLYLGANINDASGDPPTPGSYRLNGHIKSFKIYPTNLSDNVLASITS